MRAFFMIGVFWEGTAVASTDAVAGFCCDREHLRLTRQILFFPGNNPFDVSLFHNDHTRVILNPLPRMAAGVSLFNLKTKEMCR